MVTIGLLGKPSVGKSTFFSAATMQTVEIGERPFTTIKPNVGIAYVRVEDAGKEFNVQSQPRQGFIKGDYRFVPITLIDFPGLIPGAHKGKGLGNEFLSNINQVEALIYIIDISGSYDENGKFIGHGKYDPENDIKFLDEELLQWYKSLIEKNIEKIKRAIRAGKKVEEAICLALSGLGVSSNLAEKIFENYGDVDAWNIENVANFIKNETKKILIAANKIDLPYGKENYERLKKKYEIFPVFSEGELALKKAAKRQLIRYIEGESTFEIINPLKEEQKKALEKISEIMKIYNGTGLQKILEIAVFEKLSYICVFPATSKLVDKENRILPDCFLMKNGSTVYDLALKVHTDIAKSLLYAIDLKKKIKIGKDYLLKHRDVIELISAAK